MFISLIFGFSRLSLLPIRRDAQDSRNEFMCVTIFLVWKLFLLLKLSPLSFLHSFPSPRLRSLVAWLKTTNDQFVPQNCKRLWTRPRGTRKILSPGWSKYTRANEECRKKEKEIVFLTFFSARVEIKGDETCAMWEWLVEPGFSRFVRIEASQVLFYVKSVHIKW